MGTYAHTHVDKMGAQKKVEEPWIEMISNIKMNHKGLYLLCSCFFSYGFLWNVCRVVFHTRDKKSGNERAINELTIKNVFTCSNHIYTVSIVERTQCTHWHVFGLYLEMNHVLCAMCGVCARPRFYRISNCQ